MSDANGTKPCGGAATTSSGQRIKSISSRGSRASVARPVPAAACASTDSVPIQTEPRSCGGWKKSPVKKVAAPTACSGNKNRSPVKQVAAGTACSENKNKSPFKQEACSGAATSSVCNGDKTESVVKQAACPDAATANACSGDKTKSHIKEIACSSAAVVTACNGDKTEISVKQVACSGVVTATACNGDKTKSPVKKTSCSGAATNPTMTNASSCSADRPMKQKLVQPGKVIKHDAARGLHGPVTGLRCRASRSRAAPVRFGIDEHVEGRGLHGKKKKKKVVAKTKSKKSAGAKVEKVVKRKK